MAQASDFKPTFMQAFTCVQRHGLASVTSSRGTHYEVRALFDRSGRPAIVGCVKQRQVRMHEDCWGHDITCQGTRAGGILNGYPSIYDWYRTHC